MLSTGSQTLIYDKTDCLIKQVKHYCGNNIDVLFCNDREKLSELNLNRMYNVFILSNDEDDLSDIMKIHQVVKKVYLITRSIDLMLKILTIDNITIYNLDTDKYKIMNQIFNTVIAFD